MGSPRKSETFKVLERTQKKLDEFEKTEFEYIILKEKNLHACVGCFNCLTKGEEYCPHKDDRDLLIALLDNADGVIFAVPNYALQVPALMKNFLDRLAFVFHRPRFFNKSFLAIITQAVYGGDNIAKYLKEVASFWGFTNAQALVLTFLPETNDRTLSEEQKIENNISKAVKRFHGVLNHSKNMVPSFGKLFLFRLVRTSIKKNIKNTLKDYKYFNENGWFESSYYYPVKLGLSKRAVGFMAEIIGNYISDKKKKELAKKE